MAASSSDYSSSDSDGKIQEKLRWAFGLAFDKNGEFERSQGVKTIAEWYKEDKEYKDERQEDGNNKHTILSLITNRITDELIKYVEPSYKDSIIKTVGMNTHFKPGATQMNCNVEFISLKPFVKFVKQINRQEVASTKLSFELDTSMNIKKLQVRAGSTSGGKSIDIETLAIELKLSLLQARISSMRMPVPVITLNEPIKLISKRFEVNNVSFPIKQPSTILEEGRNRETVGAPIG
jgi:hypothetical protein